jgi:gluconolactonase
MSKQHLTFAIVLATLAFACTSTKESKSIGNIERLDPALDHILSTSAEIEVIATGFDWSEGPVWVEEQGMLLFSDVPRNTVYKWTQEKGVEVYLTPSGYTNATPRGGEMGSNGLLLDDKGYLVLCQHGDRRLARMMAPIDAAKPVFKTIADKYLNNRFNSPNDAAFFNGDFYFTDPPYGLEKQMDDPAKEIPAQGVYRVNADGMVTSLVDSLTRPNGIALSPDGNFLFVANSDPGKARWYRYTLTPDPSSEEGELTLTAGEIFYDASPFTADAKGLPDGMKIDSKGNIFATGPGGIFIFNPAGKAIGRIHLTELASNCALSADEKTLYVTNDMNILRIKMRE